jgi:hypothetical protein
MALAKGPKIVLSSQKPLIRARNAGPRRIPGEGCDMRFDYFVYMGNFLSSLLKKPPGTGSDRPGAEATGRVGLRNPGDHGVPDGEAANEKPARPPGRGFYRPGPLNTRVGVDAQGRPGGEPVGVLGLQAGYEWKRQAFGASEWALKPGAEREGIYIGPQWPVRDMPITPGEPGINHFDSGPDASATAFAMQFKAGLKGEVARNLLLFAEYRHLTINPTQYTFGETLAGLQLKF